MTTATNQTREHSPTPWRVARKQGEDGRGISIQAADGTFVANIIFSPRDHELANAKLIVGAVNALSATAQEKGR